MIARSRKKQMEASLQHQYVLSTLKAEKKARHDKRKRAGKKSVEDELIGYADADVQHSPEADDTSHLQHAPTAVDDMIARSRKKQMEASLQHQYVLSTLKAEKEARHDKRKRAAKKSVEDELIGYADADVLHSPEADIAHHQHAPTAV